MLPEYFVSALLGYLLGSINSAILVGKLYKIDIRKFGSGNAGATNTLRTLGKGAAALVILGDILKGVLAVIIGNEVAGPGGMLVGGLFSILGHNWPVYFGFKGGKGILTSLAVVLAVDWRVGLVASVIGILLIATTRFVSLGSIIGAIVLPILFYYIPAKDGLSKRELMVFSIIISVLAVYRHRSNIIRLVQGKESKIGQKLSV